MYSAALSPAPVTNCLLIQSKSQYFYKLCTWTITKVKIFIYIKAYNWSHCRSQESRQVLWNWGGFHRSQEKTIHRNISRDEDSMTWMQWKRKGGKRGRYLYRGKEGNTKEKDGGAINKAKDAWKSIQQYLIIHTYLEIYTYTTCMYIYIYEQNYAT